MCFFICSFVFVYLHFVIVFVYLYLCSVPVPVGIREKVHNRVGGMSGRGNLQLEQRERVRALGTNKAIQIQT